MCSEEKDGNRVLYLKLLIAYLLNKSLAFLHSKWQAKLRTRSSSVKKVLSPDKDLLSKYLPEALAEVSVGSLSLQTLSDRVE